jgi:hypothetical protein
MFIIIHVFLSVYLIIDLGLPALCFNVKKIFFRSYFIEDVLQPSYSCIIFLKCSSIAVRPEKKISSPFLVSISFLSS